MLFLRRLVVNVTPPSRPGLILARPSILVLALALVFIPLIPVPLVPRTILVSGTILCTVPIPILLVPEALFAAAGASIGARGRGGTAVGFGSVPSGSGAVGVRVDGIAFAFTVPEDGAVAELFLTRTRRPISGRTSVERITRGNALFVVEQTFQTLPSFPPRRDP